MAEKEFQITDSVEIAALEKSFAEQIEKLNKQKYTSLMEERKRVSKLTLKKSIKAPLTDVFTTFMDISLEDLNPHLKVSDLVPGGFYKSSKK
ncbi:hypothetical protein [Spiroplasma clarkii]|uniref:Uncharacterized protein n=2 Tax=Spiroplasma clarkii TaxID=2139 RepID=A0A2K8KPJ6_9MOLU|nr:hypothetical protein [Spiroplasma clarkii]ATX71076.1 hypothetical protein SCLAR_v1c07610 [Spiroplasma clarkii]